MAENPYWKNVLTIVPLLSSALATVVYLLRVFARRLGVSGWLVEDLLRGMGVLVSYGATVFVVYSQSPSGLPWTSFLYADECIDSRLQWRRTRNSGPASR